MLRCAAEALGAMIGAGLASGREVASFFAAYGIWGVAGAGAAAGVTGVVAAKCMRRGTLAVSCPRRWLTAALLLMTSGAMTAACGQVSAVMLPLHGARPAGMAAALAAAWVVSRGGGGRSAWVAAALLACITAAVAAGLLLPPRGQTVQLAAGEPLTALCRGLCYGGFNTALASPVMALGGESLTLRQRRRVSAVVAWVTFALLTGYALALRRHPPVMQAEMPVLVLLQPLGRPGVLLCAVCLALAAVTTMAAALRGLRATFPALCAGWWMAGMAAVGCAGFGRLVDGAYPVLGGLCLLLTAWEK